MLLRELFKSQQVPDVFKKFPENWREIVKNPMTLQDILEKVDAHCYSSVSDLENDFLLMCANVSIVYTPDSLITLFAVTLRDSFRLVLRATDDVEVAKEKLIESLFKVPICEDSAIDVSRSDLIELQTKLNALVSAGYGKHLSDFISRMLPHKNLNTINLVELPVSVLQALNEEVKSLEHEYIYK